MEQFKLNNAVFKDAEVKKIPLKKGKLETIEINGVIFKTAELNNNDFNFTKNGIALF